MFNFNFHLLIYFFRIHNFKFLLFKEDKRTILNQLSNNESINFLFKKPLKLIYFSYIIQQTLLFVSFVMIGFFLFSLIMSFFHFSDFILSFNKIWSDFTSLHYISFFIIFLSLFGVMSLFNLFLQFKINKYVTFLKSFTFPLSDFFSNFEDDLNKVETTPIHKIILNNNNLYGLFVFLLFEKHIEREEIKFIPEYFNKHW